jgi:cobalt-zinc-cadmium efflux system membrane fusion protein
MKNSIIFFVLLLVLGACGTETTTSTEKATVTPPSIHQIVLNAKQQRNANIEVEQAKMMGIGTTIRVTGTVETPPQNKTAISFPFGGFVKKAPLLDGMSVKKGQVLVTMEDPSIIQLQQDYLEAVSQLDFLKQEYDRQKSLGDQQINSGKTVQQAKSNYMSTQARCKGMKLKLEMAGVNVAQVEKGNLQREISIRAPFNGVVTKMNAAVGHYAAPQDILLEIIDLKHTHIELFVFEKDIPSLKVGQQVHIKLANSATTKTGTIHLIGKEISSDRMVKVHCHLDQEDDQLIPGTFVNAEIDLSATKQLTVPGDAVVKMGDKDVLFIKGSTNKEGTTFFVKEIETLGEEEGRIAFRFIETSTKSDEYIVVKGAYAVLSTILMKMQPEE